jgi:DNA repair exonuclease SbcCD ATPase subunit
MEEEQDHIPLATSTLATSDNDEFSQAIKIIESQRIKITALENTLLSKNKGTIGSEAELKKLQETLAITQKNLNISLELEIQLEQEKKALEVQFAEAKKELKNAEKELEKSKLALEKLNQQAKEKINKLKLDSDASLKSEKEKIEKQLSSRIKNLETQIETVREDVAKEKDQELRMEKQKIENLNKELTTLRGDKFRLMKDGAEGFFKKMEKADISFMSFKPGAGHITIDINDIASFLENPNVLVAEKCGLSVEAYEIWLAHYQDAVCNAPMPGGIVCGNKITRTDVPSKFKVGTSDRCTSHKGR